MWGAPISALGAPAPPQTMPITTLLQSAAAHAPGARPGAGRVLAMVGLMIVAVFALGLIIMHLRRRLLVEDADQAQGSMFEHLRAMHRRGEISQEEFDTMRRRMVEKLARSQGALSTSPAQPAGPITPPSPTAPLAAPHERRARPGFDLTGDPLPGRGEGPAHPPR